MLPQKQIYCTRFFLRDIFVQESRVCENKEDVTTNNKAPMNNVKENRQLVDHIMRKSSRVRGSMDVRKDGSSKKVFKFFTKCVF